MKDGKSMHDDLHKKTKTHIIPVRINHETYEILKAIKRSYWVPSSHIFRLALMSWLRREMWLEDEENEKNDKHS